MPLFNSNSEPIDLFAVTKQGNVELLLKGIKSRIKAAKKDGALAQGSDAGALISAEINEGWTLLMWACLHGKISCVQVLLENGADVDQERPDGCNALLIAADRGFVDCCRLLLERRALPDRAALFAALVVPFVWVQGGECQSRPENGVHRADPRCWEWPRGSASGHSIAPHYSDLWLCRLASASWSDAFAGCCKAPLAIPRRCAHADARQSQRWAAVRRQPSTLPVAKPSLPSTRATSA